jgi:O-antigen/teichoic acid export membrane protein
MTATEDLSSAEEYKGFIKDVGLVYASQIAVVVLQFVRLPILTKMLGASLYGTWALIWETTSLIIPLASLGLGMAMVRFLAAEKDYAKVREGFLSIVFAVFAAGAVTSIVLVLFSNLFATSIIGDANSTYLVRLGSLMIFSQSLSLMGIAFFRTFRQMKWYSALTVLKAAAQLGLMVCFLLLGLEVKGLIFAVLASDMLCLAIAFSMALRRTGVGFPKFTVLKGYLKYGLPLVPTSAMLWIMSASDRYMIGYFMQTKDVGIYAAAYTLTGMISLFLTPFQTVLLPAVSKSYDEGDMAKTQNYLKYSLKYLLMLTIPATFGLSVLASPLLNIFTTEEFASGNVIIPLVSFGLLLFGFYRIGLFVFYLVKKTSWVLKLLVISTALNIGLNLLLIPRIGIVGAAVATLIAYAVLAILTIVIAFRYFKFDLGFVFIMKSVLASAVMAGAIWLYKPWGITEVIIAILLGIIIYFAIILVLKGFSKKELSMIKELFSRRVGKT